MPWEMTHTKGPWKPTMVEEGLWHIERDEPSDGIKRVPIAVVDHRRDGHEPTRKVIAPARAHLIAAAPDLLDALKELVLEEYRDDDDPILNRARVQARDAIAKAEPKWLKKERL